MLCYDAPLSQSQLDQHKEIAPDNSLQIPVCNKCKRTFKKRTYKENQVTRPHLTILSSKSISITADICDNIWNQNVTLIKSKIDSAYNECVYGEKVSFELPTGAAGKGFIEEMKRLVNNSIKGIDDYAWFITSKNLLEFKIKTKL